MRAGCNGHRRTEWPTQTQLQTVPGVCSQEERAVILTVPHDLTVCLSIGTLAVPYATLQYVHLVNNTE